MKLTNNKAMYDIKHYMGAFQKCILALKSKSSQNFKVV